MRKLCYTLTVIFAFATGLVHADSLAEIAAFAEKICNQSISGGETSTTISANLNGDVNGLAKALGLSVGAGGLVKKDGSHCEGIPKDKLPSSIPTPAQCKLELAKTLIEERQKLTIVKPPVDKAALRAELELNNTNIGQLDQLLSRQSSQAIQLNSQISELEQMAGQQQTRLDEGQGTPSERAQAQEAISRARAQIGRSRDALSETQQVREQAMAAKGRKTQRNAEIVRVLAEN